LPEEETNRRWKEVTPQWPIMHVVLHGVDQNQFMARHPSNHINVVYAESSEEADRAMAVKATVFHDMDLEVHLCGVSR
jgi:L-fucose isomerase-like protein